jgi:hypothetical protein
MEIARISLANGASVASNPDGTVSIVYTPPTGKILWSANHESGDLREWYLPDSLGAPNVGSPGGRNGGGEFDSGSYTPVSVVQEQAHSGSHSAKLSINAATQASGVRLARWLEPQMQPDLFYSVWLYFPVGYLFQNWSNLFGFKSKSPSAITGTDPFFYLTMRNRANGNMYLRLEWWNQLTIIGPLSTQVGYRVYEQALMDIPVGRWFKLEARHISAGDFTGHITVWQDDIQLYDLQNVRTRYPDGDTSWQVNLYGQNIIPEPSVIYIDDAAISTDRISNSV